MTVLESGRKSDPEPAPAGLHRIDVRGRSRLWRKVLVWLKGVPRWLARTHDNAFPAQTANEHFKEYVKEADAAGKAYFTTKALEVDKIQAELDERRANVKLTEAEAELRRAEADKLRDDIEANRMERYLKLVEKMAALGIEMTAIETEPGEVALSFSKPKGLRASTTALRPVVSRSVPEAPGRDTSLPESQDE